MRTPRRAADRAAQYPASPRGGARAWLRERPWLVDLLVALAVFTYSLLTQFASIPEGLPPGTGFAVSFFLCAPYVLRRRFPLPVFGIILLVAWAQTALGVLLVMADLMVAFALYNVALRFRWTVSVPATAAVVFWLLVTVLPQLAEHDFTRGDLGVLLFVAVWAWTWGAIVRTRRAYMESLRERARQLERQREAQATIVAAAERARIAREIHDIVSHSLSVVVLMAEGASWKVRSEPDRAEEAMLTVRDTGRTALADMRRMLAVLRDEEPGSQAPQPGVAQLGPLVEEWRAAGLPVELTTSGEVEGLSEGLDLVVYRIAQEALTNARKHGGADLSRVEVTLDRRGGRLQLRIEDDGHGDNHDEAFGGGHGIVGMRERVAAHGGTLHTAARPGGGFEVSATLPIEDGE